MRAASKQPEQQRQQQQLPPRKGKSKGRFGSADRGPGSGRRRRAPELEDAGRAVVGARGEAVVPAPGEAHGVDGLEVVGERGEQARRRGAGGAVGCPAAAAARGGKRVFLLRRRPPLRAEGRVPISGPCCPPRPWRSACPLGGRRRRRWKRLFAVFCFWKERGLRSEGG